MHNVPFVLATTDVIAALKRSYLAWMLSWQDVRQRYRRSVLGPFWLTIGMAVLIGSIGMVLTQIFNMSLDKFFPFLAIGMIVWTFMAALITDGCLAFVAEERMLLQLNLPLFTYVLRLVFRHIVIFGHNIVILPLLFLVVGKSLSWVALMSLPGFLLIVLNLTWMTLVVGVLSTRYRDLPPIVASVLQVVFYITPIIWMPDLLPEGTVSSSLLTLNPAYHLLEVVRAPLLGYMPDMETWSFVLSMTLIGWIFALLLYGYCKQHIAYWL